MRVVSSGVLVAGLLLLLLPGAARAGNDPGVSVRVLLQSEEVTAGDTLAVGAVVKNTGTKDRFVLVETYLSPVAEPIPVPPVTRWERFVWLLLQRISGDFDVIHVPAGETRAVRLDVEVHPRMHGRFDVVAAARTPAGVATAREDVISKITAPPSDGGVLVHGQLYEFGSCRLLVTDDGHIYEPKGPQARWMFRLLDELVPTPDGVTVLGGILPNTIGCLGVELRVDLFRFDREPGTATGLAFRTIARGSSSRPYSGPKEEIVRDNRRLRKVVESLGAELTGKRPDFRREMVAVVTTPGTSWTRIRVMRAVVKGGTLFVHYRVCRAASTDALAAVFGQPYHLVAMPRFRGPIRFVRHDVPIRCDAYRTGVLRIDESLDLRDAVEMSGLAPTTETAPTDAKK
jgi:hypothetical protein